MTAIIQSQNFYTPEYLNDKSTMDLNMHEYTLFGNDHKIDCNPLAKLKDCDNDETENKNLNQFSPPSQSSQYFQLNLASEAHKEAARQQQYPIFQLSDYLEQNDNKNKIISKPSSNTIKENSDNSDSATNNTNLKTVATNNQNNISNNNNNNNNNNNSVPLVTQEQIENMRFFQQQVSLQQSQQQSQQQQQQQSQSQIVSSNSMAASQPTTQPSSSFLYLDLLLQHHKEMYHNTLSRTGSLPFGGNTTTTTTTNANGNALCADGNMKAVTTTNAITNVNAVSNGLRTYANANLNINENHRRLERTQSEPLTQVNASRYKTELCRPFEETGECKYGEKCQFAHGDRELRNLQRHPKYKTEMCRTFHSSGFCPYGFRCHFVHNAEEARKHNEALDAAYKRAASLAIAQKMGRHAFNSISTNSDRESPTNSMSSSNSYNNFYSDLNINSPLTASSLPQEFLYPQLTSTNPAIAIQQLLNLQLNLTSSTAAFGSSATVNDCPTDLTTLLNDFSPPSSPNNRNLSPITTMQQQQQQKQAAMTPPPPPISPPYSSSLPLSSIFISNSLSSVTTPSSSSTSLLSSSGCGISIGGGTGSSRRSGSTSSIDGELSALSSGSSLSVGSAGSGSTFGSCISNEENRLPVFNQISSNQNSVSDALKNLSI